MSGPAILWSGWERYDTLSQYVQSSPEAQSAIRKIEALNPLDIDTVSHAIRFWKTTPSELSSLYGALFVWLPTGNNKFTAYNWGIIIDISPYAGSASSTDWDYFDAYSWNWIDYPAGYNKYYQIPGDDVQLNKACFPWKWDSYYTDTNWLNFVWCTYFFGQ